MGTISLSAAALKSLIKQRDIHIGIIGEDAIPKLDYYQRSYSKLDNGKTIEYGPGFICAFTKNSDTEVDRYLSVDVGADFPIWLGPIDRFRSGDHFIDWVDRKFTVISLA